MRSGGGEHRLRAPKNRSRRTKVRLCAVFLRHILPALVLLRKPLFGLAKRRIPVTLYDSFANSEEGIIVFTIATN